MTLPHAAMTTATLRTGQPPQSLNAQVHPFDAARAVTPRAKKTDASIPTHCPFVVADLMPTT